MTNEQWRRIYPLLPKPAYTGRPRAPHRRTVEGICYVMEHKCSWHAVPRRYGAFATIFRRYQEYQASGLWPIVWGIVQEGA